MTKIETSFEGLFLIDSPLFSDQRGTFSRILDTSYFDETFIQVNHSFTAEKGTLRGMHFQHPPFAETKLIKVLSGEIQDVVIDLRKESSTYLCWYSKNLHKQTPSLLVPEGFAHGFLTLSENVNMIYFHTQVYNKESESGIHYDDPLFSIKWEGEITLVSQKDASFPFVREGYVV